MKMCDMDMRGYLSFLIMWLLSRQPMSGSSLAEELAKRRGARPNPGTIYPALKALHMRHAVTIRVEGRQKIYALTPYGKRELERSVQQFCKMFYDLFTER